MKLYFETIKGFRAHTKALPFGKLVKPRQSLSLEDIVFPVPARLNILIFFWPILGWKCSRVIVYNVRLFILSWFSWSPWGNFGATPQNLSLGFINERLIKHDFTSNGKRQKWNRAVCSQLSVRHVRRLRNLPPQSTFVDVCRRRRLSVQQSDICIRWIVGHNFLYLHDSFEEYKRRKKYQRSGSLPFAVCRLP